MTKQKQLSLCIITKNEEKFFPDCLKDMKEIVDEIIVVDLGSGNRTPELAKQFGAVVYQPKWEDDFSKIKNFCMEHASGKWVLFLQADEVISHEQLKNFKLLMQNPCVEGYLINVDDSQEEQTISCPSRLIRLIRNRKNYRFRYRSFEYIPDEKLYSLQASGLRITHRGEKAVQWQKKERIRLLQMDLKENPQDAYVRYLEGVELLNQEKYKESAASFKLALEKFGGGYFYVPHLYKCLGICLLSLKRDKEAEKILSEGFKLFPYYNDLLVLRAQLYHQLGRNEEALNDLKTCIKLRKGPNVYVPQPEIDISVIMGMLEKIQDGLDESQD